MATKIKPRRKTNLITYAVAAVVIVGAGAFIAARNGSGAAYIPPTVTGPVGGSPVAAFSSYDSKTNIYTMKCGAPSQIYSASSTNKVLPLQVILPPASCNNDGKQYSFVNIDNTTLVSVLPSSLGKACTTVTSGCLPPVSSTASATATFSNGSASIGLVKGQYVSTLGYGSNWFLLSNTVSANVNEADIAMYAAYDPTNNRYTLPCSAPSQTYTVVSPKANTTVEVFVPAHGSCNLNGKQYTFVNAMTDETTVRFGTAASAKVYIKNYQSFTLKGVGGVWTTLTPNDANLGTNW